MNPLIQLKQTTSVFLVGFGLACFGLLRVVQAVSPAPDGGYANFTTAEGEKALFSLSTGAGNTAVGWRSLFLNTTGSFNTAVGAGTLVLNTADENTATGTGALLSHSTGSANTANGAFALVSDTGGQANTAMGDRSLFSNTTGNFNVATGFNALNSNTTGNDNTATGSAALFANTTGDQNTATGDVALFSNTTGPLNTATGFNALSSNTDGDHNTATGANALFSNTDGAINTATGANALANNTVNGNTATGFDALFSNTTGFFNTATGASALQFNTTGSSNIAIGDSAGINLTTGDNNIDIFDPGVADESNTIRIGTEGTQGATYIAGIFGATAPSGTAVYVNSFGHLGTGTSSRRFKEDIRPMNKTSETLFALHPVSFRYKKEIDPAGTSQLGLVAEDVEKVNPDLVVRDKEGKPYSVRYDQVNAMLLNEFLKEHKTVQEQGATITALRANDAKQEATIGQQQKQIDALTAGLQKVGAQLEASKPAPQVAGN